MVWHPKRQPGRRGAGATGTSVADPDGQIQAPRGSSLSTRWATWVARRRRWVLSVGGVVLIAALASYPHLVSKLIAPDYSVTGSDSAKVAHQMGTDFTAAGAEQDVVVFNSKTLKITDPAYGDVVGRVLAKVHSQPGVVSVVGPTDPFAQGQVSPDGHAALASMGLSGNDSQRADRAKSIQDAVASVAGSGPVQANLTGYSPSANDETTVETADTERAESIGIPVAFVVLLLALGAVVAACLPLAIAITSLLVTFGVLSVLSFARPFDTFVLSIVTMIGVGVSIDYTLFILSRFREELVRARDEGRPEPAVSAVSTAMTTSGRTIFFSGTILVISLFSLFVVKSPFFQGMAIGAVLVVICTLVVAWTMLPALLAAFGGRVNKWSLPRGWRPAEAYEGRPERPSGWARWARTVLAHPWLALPAAALLILFALPTFGIKLGIDMGLPALANTPSGKADLVLANSFTPGVLSPIQVLATHEGSGPLSANDLSTIDKFTTSVSKDPRVAAAFSISTLLQQTEGQVSPQALARLQQDPNAASVLNQTVNVANGSNRTVVTVISKVPIDSTQASNLVKDLRNTTIPSYTASAGPQMLVGGSTAQFVDLSAETLGALPIVMALVLSFSFLYLLLIFRSLLIPTKAVLMNLLATAASFGLVTWVFQGNHLSGLLGFTSVGFIQTYLPIMVFAVLFGLSMDYEVFLIGRMREQWLKTHDNDDAVATGLAHTARPITAAAVIMAAVFGCFLVADVLELKEFGLALAAAVILDATLVRLLLVPAIMKVVGGEANWWLPGFLDRHLPRVRVD